MRFSHTEKWGFKRGNAPVSFNGHALELLHNDLHDTVDERLQIHLTMYCYNCKEEYTVRGRLPPEVKDWEYRAAVAKFITLGHFYRNTCD